MRKGERPIGAAKGKQSDTEALFPNPPPPLPSLSRCGAWGPKLHRIPPQTGPPTPPPRGPAPPHPPCPAPQVCEVLADQITIENTELTGVWRLIGVNSTEPAGPRFLDSLLPDRPPGVDKQFVHPAILRRLDKNNDIVQIAEMRFLQVWGRRVPGGGGI